MGFEPFNRPAGESANRYPGYPVAGEAGVPVAYATPAARAAFLNKVYLSLCGGVAISMASGFLVAIKAPHLLQSVFSRGPLGMLMFFAVFIGLTFGVQAVSRVRGLNVIAFALYTAVTGAFILAPLFYVGVVTTGNFDVVWNAFGLSALVFGGLTGFVLITGKDFSFLRGALMAGLLVLVGFMVAGFFFSAPAFHLGVTCGGLLLFSLFVLYNTSVIMRSYTPDMWISGALSLFLDFINIFIRILSLFLGRRE